MDDIKAKQQVVEKIKEASKILVTVSDSPSVDALSAALGLTLLFDKQEKYATAIFSGEVPPAISFLQPEKTFDATTDSLRDFIIALDKEKADHLRYKVEGDSVKIFITPYKTTISQEDLDFSQGDYNVELVIALGVENQDHLDRALEDHGQILHDATVITVSAGDQSSNLGGIDWHDANASSLSEMVAGLAEALKEDKKKPLIDAQIATALLTGVVAQTDRFSNEHTTSKVMTVAAQLMSAGADQQLIATELEAPAPEPEPVVEQPAEEVEEEPAVDEPAPESTIKKDLLTINHDADESHDNEEATTEEAIDETPGMETLAELDKRVRHTPRAEDVEDDTPVEQPEVEQPVVEDPETTQEPEEQPSEPEVKAEPETVAPEAAPVQAEPTNDPAPEVESIVQPKADAVSSAYSLDEDEIEPSLGGTLNATSEQAAEDARRAALSGQNKTILSHAYLGGQDGQAEQVSNPIGTSPGGFPGTPPEAPGSMGINQVEDDVRAAYASVDQADTSAANSAPTFGTGGERVIAPLQPAPVAQPAPPAAPAFGLPLPPPLPDFSQGMPTAPASPLAGPYAPSLPPVNSFAITPEPTTQPEILGDILAPEPTSVYSVDPKQPPTPPADPGQFKIPS
jgi:nanoRNase/pAp phosphatase (c-di-AMP/oligoRNAs hydrolase)